MEELGRTWKSHGSSTRIRGKFQTGSGGGGGDEQIARDIIKDLEPNTEGLHELNRNLKMKKPPRIAGKRKRENLYVPLAARFNKKLPQSECAGG